MLDLYIGQFGVAGRGEVETQRTQHRHALSRTLGDDRRHAGAHMGQKKPFGAQHERVRGQRLPPRRFAQVR